MPSQDQQLGNKPTMPIKMAATFECFPNLPPELRTKVFRHALAEEDRSRILVIFDNRVMPFKSLVSPLLSVNALSRELAKAHYTTKLDIFTIPINHLLIQLVRDLPDRQSFMSRRKKQLEAIGCVAMFEGNNFAYGSNFFMKDESDRDDGIIDLEQHWIKACVNDLEAATGTVFDLQDTTVTQGTLYLNPAQNTILYGHNCSPDFFPDMRDHMAPGTGNGKGPVLRHFSSNLPDSFYTSLRQEDAGTSRCFLINSPSIALRSDQRYATASPCHLRRTHELFKTWDLDEHTMAEPPLAFKTLRLTMEDTHKLMAYISTSPDILPGYIECWVDMNLKLPVQTLATGANDDSSRPVRRPRYCPLFTARHSARVNIMDCEELCEIRQLALTQGDNKAEGQDQSEEGNTKEDHHEEEVHEGEDGEDEDSEDENFGWVDRAQENDDWETLCKKLDMWKQRAADLEQLEQNIQQIKTQRQEDRPQVEGQVLDPDPYTGMPLSPGWY